LTEITIILII